MLTVASATVPRPTPATYRMSRSLRRTGIYCAVGNLLILSLAALLQLLGVALDRVAVLSGPFLVSMLLVGTMLFMWGGLIVVLLIALFSNRARLRAQRAELLSWQSTHANDQAHTD